MFSQLRLSILVVVLTALFSSASASQVDQAELLVKEIAGKLLEVAKKKETVSDSALKDMIATIEKEMVPHINRDRIIKRVLDKHWQSTDPKTREAFASAFERSLQIFLAKNLIQYQDLSIKFKDTLIGKSGNAVMVRTTVGSELKNQKIDVDYYLRLDGEDRWLVEDFRIDAISFIGNKQEEFARLLAKGGVDKLTAELVKNNEKAL